MYERKFEFIKFLKVVRLDCDFFNEYLIIFLDFDSIY